MGHRSRAGWGGDTPIWHAPYNFSSISNLPQDLTINGVTVSPSLRYEGKNATVNGWTATVGPNLTSGSTGADPLVGRDTPLIDPADKAVRVMGGKVFESSTTDGIIDTEDFVVEYLLGWACNSSSWVSGKWNVTTSRGYMLYSNSGSLRFSWGDGTTQNVLAYSTSLYEQWLHIFIAVDRSEASTNQGKIFINGVLAASSSATLVSNSLNSTTSKFVLGGGENSGTYTYKQNDTSDIAYFAMYKQNNWFAGGAQNATDWELIARTRCSQLAGVMPSIYTGTQVPTIKTRTSAAFLDKINPATGIRRLFYMGSGWPRICQRTNYSGTSQGLIQEASRADRLNYSSTPNNATYWTHTNIATPTMDGTDLPWPTATVYKSDPASSMNIIPDATLGQHGASGVTQALSATIHIVSVFAKAVGKNWLNIYNATAGMGCTFDLANGVVGTQTGACEPSMESWGNGWYWCFFRFTSTAAIQTIHFRAATDTTDTTYSGDGTTVGIKIWQPQVVVGISASLGYNVLPHMPFLNTALTTTQAADRLTYSISSMTGPGALQCDTVSSLGCLSNGNNSTGYLAILTETSGAAASTSSVLLCSRPLTKVAGAVVYNASSLEANITGTSDIVDGYTSTILMNFDTNYVQLKVDGIQEGTPDTTATIPTVAFLQVGSVAAGTNQSEAPLLISNLKIWNKLR